MPVATSSPTMATIRDHWPITLAIATCNRLRAIRRWRKGGLHNSGMIDDASGATLAGGLWPRSNHQPQVKKGPMAATTLTDLATVGLGVLLGLGLARTSNSDRALNETCAQRLPSSANGGVALGLNGRIVIDLLSFTVLPFVGCSRSNLRSRTRSSTHHRDPLSVTRSVTPKPRRPWTANNTSGNLSPPAWPFLEADPHAGRPEYTLPRVIPGRCLLLCTQAKCAPSLVGTRRRICCAARLELLRS